MLTIALTTPPAIIEKASLEGRQMTQYEHCAASPFAIGDGFPWGYIVYISPIVDQQKRVVGWIYASDHGNLTIQANAYMNDKDKSLAHIKRPGAFYHFTTSPWSDLTIEPCPDSLITKGPLK